MRLLIAVLALLSFSAHAENWVVTPSGALMYDKDSIVRLGAFSEVVVGESGSAYGTLRFDCKKPLALSRANHQDQQQGWFPVGNQAGGMEVREAACSKWWEFWKR